MKRNLILFIFLLLFVSCKEKQQLISGTAYSNVCRTESFALPDNFAPNPFSQIKIDGEYIYFHGYMQDQSNKSVICRFDNNGENPQLIFDTDSSPRSYTFDDGSVIKVDIIVNDKYWEEVSLTKLSKNGSTEFVTNADYLFDITVMNIPVDISGEIGFNITDIIMLNDMYFIASQDAIAVIDQSGVRKSLIKATSGKIQGLIMLKTGELIAVTRNASNMNYTVAYINTDNYSFGDKLSLPDDLFRGIASPSLHIGDEYDIYIKNATGLYGYDIGQEAVEIINWINSDILGRTIQSIKIISHDEILYTMSDWATQTHEIGKMTLIPESELEEKIILILAKMLDGGDIENYVVNFNRQNEKYRIIISDYNQYEIDRNYEQSILMFNMDIAAGNIPDIFMYWGSQYSGSYPIDSYISQGLFADIFELFENDAEFSSDMLADYVRIPFAQDGKLYMLPHTVYIDTVIGKKANFPMTSWTQSEMIDYVQSLPDDVELMEFISILNNSTILDFIDTENKTTNFDSDEFKKIVEFYKNYTYPALELDRDQRRAMFRNDKLLLNIAMVSSFHDIYNYKYIFGSDISYIGYPTLSGNGSYLSSHDYFSVSAKSKHIDGAVEFIKFILADKYQFNETDYFSMNFPVTKSALGKYIDWILSKTYARRDSGLTYFFSNPLTEEDENYIEEFNQSNDKVFVTTISQEEVDELLRFLNTLNTKQSMDWTPIDIFWEEFSPYFLDTTNKSYDEIVGVVQNRIEIYLNEKY